MALPQPGDSPVEKTRVTRPASGYILLSYYFALYTWVRLYRRVAHGQGHLDTHNSSPVLPKAQILNPTNPLHPSEYVESRASYSLKSLLLSVPAELATSKTQTRTLPHDNHDDMRCAQAGILCSLCTQLGTTPCYSHQTPEKSEKKRAQSIIATHPFPGLCTPARTRDAR